MKTPISYLQTDSRWKNTDYSTMGESTTIGKSGCGPSCMAMVIATLKDSSVTPVTTCAWSLKKGYKAVNQGTYYTYFVPPGAAYNIILSRVNTTNIYGSNSIVASTSHEKALAAVKAGNWVVCCMGKGNWTSSGHYILWYGVNGNNALIRDPNSTKIARTNALISLLQSQVKYYWIVELQDANLINLSNQVKTKFGLSDATMTYLSEYPYAINLFEKLLAGTKTFSDITITYLKKYKYWDSLKEKLGIEA